MANYVATMFASTITDESGNVVTDESGNSLFVEQGGSPLTFAGTGTLSAQTTASNNGNQVNLVGNGALTVAINSQQASGNSTTVSLAGAGALTTARKIAVVRTATLSGAGSLAVGGGQLSFANASLTGNGALNPSVNVRFPASAALSGNGALSVEQNNRGSVVNLTGSGALGAFGRIGSSVIIPPNTLKINTKRNITGYAVEENATPTNPASTEGGVGTIQFGFPATPNWLMLYEQDIELDDDYRGTTSGKISAITRTNDLLNVVADNRLSTLVGETRARPMTGTFENVARAYLKLGQITDGIYFHSDVKDIPVTVQGWAGDAWLNIKQLCTAYDVEVSLVSGNVSFRPTRSLVINPRKLVTFDEHLESSDLAKNVEVTYYTNTWADGELMYPRTPEEVLAQTVYQVEANSVIEDDIELSASLDTVVQPICVDDVTQDYNGTQSVYSVRGVDNSQITAQHWNSMGGKIELSINNDTTSVHVKITGPSDQYYGPYRICGRVKEVEDITLIILPPDAPLPNAEQDAAAAAAAEEKRKQKEANDKKKSKGSAKRKVKPESAKDKAARLKKEAQEKKAAQEKAERDANAAFNDTSQSEEDYASLRIIGTGVQIDKDILTLPTGVPSNRTSADVGVTIESPYIGALEDAYRLGMEAVSAYRGEVHTLTANLSQINQRMGTGSVLYRTIGQLEDQYRGLTIGEFEQQNAGKTIGQFNADQKALVVDNFDNQVFGNVCGTRFRVNDAMFRITDSTTSESDVQISAVRDTMIGEFNETHDNMTISQFNQLYAGRTIKEFGRIPLLGG